MKAIIKFAFLISFTFLVTNTTAQSTASPKASEGFINVLSKVPQFFIEWISKTDQIAQNQDKEKFAAIGRELYRDIDKLAIAKKMLIKRIQDDPNRSVLRSEMDEYLSRIRKLQATLAKSDQLSKKLGMDAIKLSSALDYDLTSKSLIMINLSSTDNSKQVLKDLAQALFYLEDAKTNIDLFISKLEE